jgi:hypothetical protein
LNGLTSLDMGHGACIDWDRDEAHRGGHVTRRLVAIAAVLAAPMGMARADEPFRHARVRVVEPLVTLQSATETASEEAVPNLPFLPGDRIWTDGRGRIELHFADGSLVRVDSRSKIDYDGYSTEHGGQVVLRLWSGSVYVHDSGTSLSPEFVIETPSAAANLRSRGVYRVDAIDGETRLSVFDGGAYFDAADRVLVRGGERAFARRGERVAGPDRFDRGEEPDAFARWDAELGHDASGPSRRSEYLPEELSPFAEDLERSGAWSFEVGVGNVWRPYVSPSWQPYSYGRWAWTAYGWTWVPNEPWGWAPSHYGRWGYANGWYWVPGHTWGPAWVSWSAGHDYVGWCPLGYGDRTVVAHGRGRAVPRGTAVAASSPWTYVRRADLGARDVAIRRVQPAAVQVAQMRTVDVARARILRDGTVGEGAVPRVRTRPGVGDTVPELRTDNTTTLPLPVARTRYESEGERDEERKGSNANATAWPRSRREPADTSVRQDRGATPDIWGWSRQRLVAAEQASPQATPSPESAVRRRTEPSRTDDGDREALRPWFEKITRPRDKERTAPEPREEQASPRQRPRPQDTPRAEPRQIRSEPKRERQSPPPPPPPQNDGGRDRGAVRRERNRDQ